MAQGMKTLSLEDKRRILTLRISERIPEERVAKLYGLTVKQLKQQF